MALSLEESYVGLDLKKLGFSILSITFLNHFYQLFLYFTAVFLFTKNLSFLVGALAAATAPGGTTQIIQEYRARGPLTSTLYGVVGADDAFAIIIYTIAYNISKTILIAQEGLNFGQIMLYALLRLQEVFY